MKFQELEIPGVFLIEPRVFGDDRGAFFETYRTDLFKQHGIEARFIQDNQSNSTKGVLRGLHLQCEPKAQAKLVRVLSGAAFDVVVDLRKNGPTFGKQLSLTLSAENKKMLYVPKGLAHGFCAMEDHTVFLYKVDEFYSPEHERGIIWNDPKLGIQWPKLDVPYQISDRDQKFPTLASFSS